MCPYCKDNSRVVFKIKDNERVDVKLKPNDKYYKNEAITAVCRACKKEFLITMEYKEGITCPCFCNRKFEEVEVI